MGCKRKIQYMFMVLLASIFLTHIVAASPSEYLFPGETLGPELVRIDIDDSLFTIRSINDKEDLIVIDKEGFLPSDGESKKTLFAYYTHVYVKENNQEIADHYQATYNTLDDQSEEFGQKVLNALKLVDNICVKVPEVEILEVCVRPSDELGIKDFFGKTITDWEEVIGEYDKLGAKIVVAQGNSGRIKYKLIEELYSNMRATQSLLESATKATGVTFPSGRIVNADVVSETVWDESIVENDRLRERERNLKRMEMQAYETTESQLKDAKAEIKLILGLNQGASELKTRLSTIESRFSKISLNDQKYRTDLDTLENIDIDAQAFQIDVNSSYEQALETHNNKNGLSKTLAKLIGSVRSFLYL